MKKLILFIVFGIALQMVVLCQSYSQETVAFKFDTAAVTHDLQVAFESQRKAEESQREAEKKIQESRINYLVSAIALEGILIIILVPVVLVQKKKINRFRNS